MNKLALVAMLGALTCAPALAQEAPPAPPANFPAPPNMHAMMQVHTDERTAMLNALTPEHKQLLASIAGQLAISTTPDFDAAAKQLDAALSAAEKQAITNAEQAALAKMEASMKDMPAPVAGAEMYGPGPSTNRVYRSKNVSWTAGTMLVHIAMGDGPMMLMTASMRDMEGQP